MSDRDPSVDPGGAEATSSELDAQLQAEVEAALGSSFKEPVKEEMFLRDQLRRSLVAAKDIEEGEPLTGDNITVKRSSKAGIEPKHYDDVLGKRAKSRISKDAPITIELV